MPATAQRPRRGFTLIELLVVIAIIVLLISILLPVVSTVRVRAQVTQTQAQMDKLRSAVMNYYMEWHAYPGPLSNTQLANNRGASQTNITGLSNVTSSENLALGLLGYLDVNYNNPSAFPTLSQDANTRTFPPRPPKHDVLNLNPVQPKTFHYLDYVPSEVSPGYWLGGPNQLRITDSNGSQTGTPTPRPITDTIVPEFIDTIFTGIGTMPILYVRANVGAPGVDYDARTAGSATTPAAQYDISQFAPYGFTTVNTNDFPMPTGIPNTTQWTGYLMNPNIAGTPRGKDGFILISAGADRQYGTADDIIVTP